MKMPPVYPLIALLTALAWGCAGSSSRIPGPPLPAPPSTPSTPSTSTPSPSTSSTGGGEDAGIESRADHGERTGEGAAEGPEAKAEAEAAAEAEAKAVSGTGAAGSAGTPGRAGAQTGDEKRAGLDEDLDESLREFDEILMREQEALEERHDATAAASAGRGSGSGSAMGRGRGHGAETGGNEAELPGTGGSPDTPPHDEPAVEAGTGGPVTEPGHGDIPDDVGDGADDDIVARQLREAAMNEEDPELREKLWDEYRAYKAGLKK